MDKVKGWNVATARKQFAKVLRAAEHEPQYVYRRGKVAAVVVSPQDHAKRGLQTGGSPVAGDWKNMKECLDEISRIARETGYGLKIPKRTTRPNAFAEMLHQRSRRH